MFEEALDGLPGVHRWKKRMRLLWYMYNPKSLRLNGRIREFLLSDLRAYTAQQELYDDGDIERHRTELKRVLEVDPWNPSALAYLTLWGDDTYVDRIVAYAMSRGRMTSVTQYEMALLWFAMARFHERKGWYDRAWPCYEHGNAALLEQFPYDVEEVREKVDAFGKLMDRRMVRGFHGNLSHKPVFIVGLPRSGTTLLETMLAGHPSVLPLGEQMWVQDTVMALDFVLPPRPDLVRKLGNRYMRNAMLFDPRVLVHKRFTDKMPANWVLAGLIAMALPHAKILWLVRDPIDNLISAWREPMAGHGWAASFDGLASRWRAMNRSLEVAVHTLPDWMLKVVRYEDLVVDAENTMRGILEHLELPWNAGVLSPETVERRITTASLLQARQPITTQSIGWWSRIYEKPLEPLRARLVDPRQDAAA